MFLLPNKCSLKNDSDIVETCDPVSTSETASVSPTLMFIMGLPPTVLDTIALDGKQFVFEPSSCLSHTAGLKAVCDLSLLDPVHSLDVPIEALVVEVPYNILANIPCLVAVMPLLKPVVAYFWWCSTRDLQMNPSVDWSFEVSNILSLDAPSFHNDGMVLLFSYLVWAHRLLL